MAIISDVVLVLGNSTWSKEFWAESFPYPMFAMILIVMTTSVKSFYPIGLFYILVSTQHVHSNNVYHKKLLYRHFMN